MEEDNVEIELTLIQTQKGTEFGIDISHHSDDLVSVDAEADLDIDATINIEVGTKNSAENPPPKSKKQAPAKKQPPPKKPRDPSQPGIFDKARYPEADPSQPPQVTIKLNYKYILEKCLDYDLELGGNIRYEDDDEGGSDPFFKSTHEIKKITQDIKQTQDQRNAIRKKYGKNLQSIDMTTRIHDQLDIVEEKVDDVGIYLQFQEKEKK